MALDLIADNCVVCVYRNQSDAEEAVSKLKAGGINLQDISIAGGEDVVEKAAMGEYKPPEFVEQGLQHQAEREGIWMGGLYGVLIGCGTLLIPGIGPLMVLGPLAGAIGGMSAGALLGDAFGELNFTEIAADYRAQLVAGNLLLLVHCTAENEMRVRHILEDTRTVDSERRSVDLQTQP